MKKMLYLLFILSSSFVYAMNDESSLLRYFSSYIPTWFSCNQASQKSKLVSDLYAFENQLRDDWVRTQLYYGATLRSFLALNITTIPVQFLKYCYYQKFHERSIAFSLNELESSMLRQCQDAQIDGYSALGVAMVVNDVSSDAQRKFIQELVNHDFKPTVKDVMLAALYLYNDNEVVRQKETFVHLLHSNPSANWYILPHDVRKEIVHYLIQLIKKDVWLIPEKKVSKFNTNLRRYAGWIV